MAVPNAELGKVLAKAHRRSSIGSPDAAAREEEPAAAAEQGPPALGKLRLRIKQASIGVDRLSVTVRPPADAPLPPGSVVKVEWCYNTVASSLFSLVGSSWTELPHLTAPLPTTVLVEGLSPGYEVQVRAVAGEKGEGEAWVWGPVSEVVAATTSTPEAVAAAEAAAEAAAKAKADKLEASRAAAAAKAASRAAEEARVAAVAGSSSGPGPDAVAAPGPAVGAEVATLPRGRVRDVVNQFGGGVERSQVVGEEAQYAAASADMAAVMAALKQEEEANAALVETLEAAKAAAAEGQAATEAAQTAMQAELEATKARLRLSSIEVEALKSPGPAPALEATLVSEAHDRMTVRFLLDIIGTDEAPLRERLGEVEALAHAGLPLEGVRAAVVVYYGRKAEGQEVSEDLSAFVTEWVAHYHIAQ